MKRIDSLYFNSRSREGSDQQESREFDGINSISIHAPVKGATVKSIVNEKRDRISIHAPVKGATASKQKTQR